MSPSEMMERLAEASPRFKARIAGVFCLLTILTGGLAIFVRGRLVVSGDAAATATNILAHAPLFWLGVAAGFIAASCYIAVTLLLYDMFKPVNSNLSLFAAFFSLVGCVIAALSCLFHLASLVVLGVAQYLSDFRQLRALALTFLKLRDQASDSSLVFVGIYCILIGYLILRSTFLPRILGLLMALGGLGWLTFFLPSLSKQLYPYNMAPGIIGEAALTLWLLVVGLNEQRWKEQDAVSV